MLYHSKCKYNKSPPIMDDNIGIKHDFSLRSLFGISCLTPSAGMRNIRAKAPAHCSMSLRPFI